MASRVDSSVNAMRTSGWGTPCSCNCTEVRILSPHTAATDDELTQRTPGALEQPQTVQCPGVIDAPLQQHVQVVLVLAQVEREPPVVDHPELHAGPLPDLLDQELLLGPDQ